MLPAATAPAAAAPSARRQRAPSPTHFVALRVTSPAVSAVFARVQDQLAAHDPLLAATFVSADTAHLTLGVLTLDDAAVSQAAAALASVAATAPRPRLAGVKQFRSQACAALRYAVLPRALC